MEKTIYLAGGCFWGTQQYFALLQGVTKTEVGYANSNVQNPTYEQVCSGSTHAAETVAVTYDDEKIPLSFILDMYFKVIDPTALNRQGHDVGTQYRTGIYYTDPQDAPTVRSALDALQQNYNRPLAVEAAPLQNFYSAEEYHQNYLVKNPGGYCHVPQAAFAEARSAKPSQKLVYRKATQKELADALTPLQYDVTQNAATEAPFTNEYNAKFDPGIYVDITTGEPLFVSTDKFESGCGWPSFSRPIKDSLLEEKPDYTLSRPRTEVRSKLSDAHLGHVFEDGLAELGGLRYCINSASLRFIAKEKMEAEGYGEYLSLVR